MARKFLVGGDWKYNESPKVVKKIVTTLNEAQVPSHDVRLLLALHLFPLSLSKGCCGKGPFCPEMLVKMDIPWVILGETERRAVLNETNECVGDKVAYALSQGLKVIACVGETLQQRESGSTMSVVAAQTKAIAEKITNWDNVVLAYEPVWAIRTEKVATPAQAQEGHYKFRKWLSENVGAAVAASIRIIYGGFVNGVTCQEFAAQPDVDGFLVGEPSMKPEFIDIIKSATVKKN